MYICIEGNIGAGKSTLAKAIAKKRKATFLAESYEDNPLLPLFYKDKKKMAFPLEYSFLIDRHAQLHNYFKNTINKNTVADFSLYKCLWFAKANLNKKEYLLYKKHFKAIEEVSPTPDLIVFINTNTTNLLRNIKSRNRTFELNIDKKYLKKVALNYEEGIKKLNIPILEIKIQNYSKNLISQLIKVVSRFTNENENTKYKRINL